MIVQKLMTEWLTAIEPIVKHRTYQRYVEIIERHILPALGCVKIKKLTEGAIMRFLSELKSRPLSDNSIAQILGVIKRAMRYGVSLKYLKFSPAENIRSVRSEASVEAFTEKEQSVIEGYIAKSRDNKLYGVIIALYTGLRIGELLALTRGDVDFNSRTINVDKTLLPVRLSYNNAVSIGTPKTKSSVRRAPFPRLLTPYLKALTGGESDYLFSTRTGKPISISSYQRSFGKLLRTLDIKHKGFHALRHTYATRSIESGADMKTLSEILGHSSPRITMERYVHSSDKQKKILADRLGERLKKTPICLIGVHKLTI